MAKVTVASKLPMKIEMQCCSKRVEQRSHQGQVWREEVSYKDGPMHIIAGTAHPKGDAAEMMPRPQMIAGGYVLTRNVDADLFSAWMLENKDSALVKNRLIFGFAQIDTVEGTARESKDVDSGLGWLVPDKDRRMPKKIGVSQARALPESNPDQE
jgi:hypothetical protein